MAWHGHMTDGDYTDNLSQSFCLSWLGFGLGSGQDLSKIVLYNIFECQTFMNMPFNNNTFTDKLVGQKQIKSNLGHHLFNVNFFLFKSWKEAWKRKQLMADIRKQKQKRRKNLPLLHQSQHSKFLFRIAQTIHDNGVSLGIKF